ncbi:MAG: helix-turn-helix domain-containing protein [Gemmatimonadota bacterium]
MNAPGARPLVVEVLGAVPGDLVPTDPGIECRRGPVGPREGGAGPGRAHVLVVDLDGESEGAVDGVAEIRRAFDPELPGLILAVSGNPARARAALAAGATDFALLPRDREWLVDAILRERDRRFRLPSGGEPQTGRGRLVVEIPSEGLSFEEYERHVVEHALSRAGWNRSRAARELGISRPRLVRKIERHGLVAPVRMPRDPSSE